MAKPLARRALGRGLTNLIPQDTEELGSGNEVVFVDINAIRPNPFQPRTVFNEEEIHGLAESIKNQGLLQPIVLRKKHDGYEIISGERRFRAMGFLGNDQVPAIVKPSITDREMMEMALVENIQREDLNELEKAYAYQKLLLECGLSHEELSLRVGKSRSVITNALRLLKLPQVIQDMLSQNKLTAGHARSLVALDDEQKQLALAERIIADGLTVRDVEALATVGKDKKPKESHKKAHETIAPRDPDLAAVIEQLQYRFGSPIVIKPAAKDKGKIEINYFSKDDFNRIYDLLMNHISR